MLHIKCSVKFNRVINIFWSRNDYVERRASPKYTPTCEGSHPAYRLQTNVGYVGVPSLDQYKPSAKLPLQPLEQSMNAW